MIRLTRLADYAVVLMAHMAEQPEGVHSASGISAITQIPAPTVSKILGTMARAGILTSHRGLNGGFSLALSPVNITLAAIISAVDGPIALTNCIEDDHADCDILGSCRMRGYWQKINLAVRGALENITLAELSTPVLDFFPDPNFYSGGEPARTSGPGDKARQAPAVKAVAEL